MGRLDYPVGNLLGITSPVYEQYYANFDRRNVWQIYIITHTHTHTHPHTQIHIHTAMRGVIPYIRFCIFRIVSSSAHFIAFLYVWTRKWATGNGFTKQTYNIWIWLVHFRQFNTLIQGCTWRLKLKFKAILATHVLFPSIVSEVMNYLRTSFWQPYVLKKKLHMCCSSNLMIYILLLWRFHWRIIYYNSNSMEIFVLI